MRPNSFAKSRIALLGAGVVDAHRHDLEAPAARTLVQRLDARHLDAARHAPRRPDVEQHDLALVVGERLRAPASPSSVTRAKSAAPSSRPSPGTARRRGSASPRASPPASTSDDAATIAHCWRRVITLTPRAQRARSAPISARGSCAEKIALPATKVSAPARQHARDRLAVDAAVHLERRALRAASSIWRARAILSTDAGMNACPPKPGFTVITSSRSRSPSTSLDRVERRRRD